MSIEDVEAERLAMRPRQRGRGALELEARSLRARRREVIPTLLAAGISDGAIAEAAHLTWNAVAKRRRALTR